MRLLTTPSLVRHCLAAGALFLSACGGATPADSTTLDADEAQAGAEGDDDDDDFVQAPPSKPKQSAIELLGMTGPDKPWAEMSYEEREWYMVGKIHPIMREVFTGYDARFSEFECAPCHGDDGMQKKYKMPSAHLTPVPALDSEEYKAMQGSKLVTFMREEVTANMATLLGVQAHGAEDAGAEAFSCHDCHPSE